MSSNEHSSEHAFAGLESGALCQELAKQALDHGTVIENLNISACTSVALRDFCSEVIDYRFKKDSMGRPGVTEETDMTLIVHRKYEMRLSNVAAQGCGAVHK